MKRALNHPRNVHALGFGDIMSVGIGLSPASVAASATLAEAGMPNGRQVTQLLCVPGVLAVYPLNLTAEHLRDRLDSVP
jgi:hypothetical protein